MTEFTNSVENTFYYLCRLCALKFDTPGLGIFSNEGLWREMPKKIQDCLHITVEENDRCPKSICVDCVFKLDLYNEFLLKCLEAQQFLTELFKHGMFDNINYVVKNEMQRCEFEILEMPEMNYQSSSIQELEHLVEEAHIHADSNDITQIIQYHDGEINEEQITEINQINQLTTLQKDPYPLPDIALYSFDDISDAEETYLENTTFEGTDSNVKFDEILNEKTEMIEMTATHEHIEEVQLRNEIEELTSNEKHVEETEVEPEAEEKPEKKLRPATKICEICQKSFRSNGKLTEHMKIHSAVADFKCPVANCGKMLRSKIGLIEHEAKHTGLYKYACTICGKGFQIKSYLTIHEKSHSDERRFKCTVCGLMLKSKQTLINHENRHFGLKPFACTMCDQKFISKSLQLDHERTQHLNSEPDRKYPCPICEKKFVRRSYLKTHMTIHSGDKPFVCDICGNKFLTGLDLKQHTKTHTGERPHICEICGKAFARSDSLKVHMRSHTGERPYKCVFCDQQFAQISSMKVHVRLHTGEKPYLCTICDQSFISRLCLQTHMKKHDTKLSSDTSDILDTDLNILLAT